MEKGGGVSAEGTLSADRHRSAESRPSGDRRVGVVQLRIHGVGGATPEGLLGLERPEQVVRVAGDDSADFSARCEDTNVEGYVWGRLTSGPAVQPLWIFLLPLTLYNVSGWMFSPKDRLLARPLRPLVRLLHWLTGIGLTLIYVLWLAEILLQGTFYRPDSVVAGWIDRVLPKAPLIGRWFDPIRHPAALGMARFGVGLAVLLAVGVLVGIVSGRTRHDYEGVESKLAADEADAPEGGTWLFGTPMTSSERLNDRSFWSHQKDAARLALWHLIAAGALVVVIVIRAFPSLRDRSQYIGLASSFAGVMRVEVLLLLALLVLTLVTWRPRADGFRVAGPAIAAATGVGLANGLFSGLAALLKVGSLDLDISAAWGVGTVAFVIALIAFLLWHLVFMRGGLAKEFEQEVGAEIYKVYDAQPPYGVEYGAMTRSMRSKVLAVRGLSQGIRNADLLLTWTSGVFLLFSFFVVWNLWSLPRGFATFGALVVNTVVAFAIPILVLRGRQPSARKKVGITWDILTFWPRRHHPFAVRPYAERAVPEFQDRLLFHRSQGRRVVACAHSQGTVIAYAALQQLTEVQRADIAFVTFGCPLYQLYVRFFPEMFSCSDFLALRSVLAHGHQDIGWKSFYRRTDYVGQVVFPGTSGIDVRIPDPPTKPSRANPGGTVSIVPDSPPPIWTKLSVHSLYNNTPEMRAWVDRDVTPAFSFLAHGVDPPTD